MLTTEAIIHSKAKKTPDHPYAIVTILHEDGPNDVVVKYEGVRYMAIFNPFVCRYYVDDLYGKLKDQNYCPTCNAYIEQPNES